MGVLRDRVVVVLLVLVLVGSALSVRLALTRPGPDGVATPPGSTGDQAPGFRPAALEGPGGAALDAAVPAVSAALGYDYRDLDGSLARVTATMTQRPAADATRQFGSDFRAAAVSGKQVTVGLVRGAGVVRVADDATVVCLLYVDQRLAEGRAPAGAAPRVLGRYRARVQMVLVDGAWLVDDLALTPAR